MTAHTIENTTGSVLAAPAGLRRLRVWLTSLCRVSVEVELDPYLAADICQRSYAVRVIPDSFLQAFKDAAIESRALAGEQANSEEIERCVRSYDAPLLEASWAQAIRQSAASPGLLHRARSMLARLSDAFVCSPLESLDAHMARDIGIEFETRCVTVLRQGGF